MTTHSATLKKINLAGVVEYAPRIHINDVEYQRVGVPSAFNWTPAMSAVFPVRLTMSQLTAMWDALHGAAEYEELGSKSVCAWPDCTCPTESYCKPSVPKPLAEEKPNADGWIIWYIGYAVPKGLVDVRTVSKGDFLGVSSSGIEWSAMDSGYSITHWRPAK